MLLESIELPTFNECSLHLKDKNQVYLLLKNQVKIICHYVLGPSGSNIEQAAIEWSKIHNVLHKVQYIYCDTPEQALSKSQSEKDIDRINLAWTCAVYYREHELFFNNTEHNLFFEQIAMRLDCMQLACRKGATPSDDSILIASHPSPSVLLASLSSKYQLTDANSNSHAALMCAQGYVDACITTESARKANDLFSLHEFGSPEMVFFASLPPSSSAVIKGLVNAI